MPTRQRIASLARIALATPAVWSATALLCLAGLGRRGRE